MYSLLSRVLVVDEKVVASKEFCKKRDVERGLPATMVDSAVIG